MAENNSSFRPVSGPWILLICLLVFSVGVYSQESVKGSGDLEISNPGSAFDRNPVEYLNDAARRIQEKQVRKNEILSGIKGRAGSASEEEAAEIREIVSDTNRLQQSLMLSVTGDTTLAAYDQQVDQQTTWQEDVVDILKPLADSLKSITKRPRQIAELRAELEKMKRNELSLRAAIRKFGQFEDPRLENTARNYIDNQLSIWQDDLQQLEEERIIVSGQLDELQGKNQGALGSVVPNLKKFFLGTGLTLVLALLAAIATYFLMRAGWWLYSTKIVSKDVRRNSTLYRVFSYSYHLITGIIIILAGLVVIYLREDLLLLAIAFLLIAGTLFNLKQFLPKYIAEARLLLNMGGVREDERVVYNGLPWQVKSINLYSVLHNPALDGIVRLPLRAMEDLVSRPVKNKLWFPTRRGDYVILPDGMLGQVKYQTPDLVELAVRGGMALTYTTANFYTLNIINLSREDTFGVTVTFGLDYSLQKSSVTEVPEALHEAITQKLSTAGYEADLVKLIVELAAANTSSLDFLVFATLDKRVAGDFYKLERLILQTCVEVSNDRNWTIPFPQLTIHSASPSAVIST